MLANMHAPFYQQWLYYCSGLEDSDPFKKALGCLKELQEQPTARVMSYSTTVKLDISTITGVQYDIFKCSRRTLYSLLNQPPKIGKNPIRSFN